MLEYLNPFSFIARHKGKSFAQRMVIGVGELIGNLTGLYLSGTVGFMIAGVPGVIIGSLIGGIIGANLLGKVAATTIEGFGLSSQKGQTLQPQGGTQRMAPVREIVAEENPLYSKPRSWQESILAARKDVAPINSRVR
jgi:hypothetical protein